MRAPHTYALLLPAILQRSFCEHAKHKHVCIHTPATPCKGTACTLLASLQHSAPPAPAAAVIAAVHAAYFALDLGPYVLACVLCYWTEVDSVFTWQGVGLGEVPLKLQRQEAK